MNARLRFVVLLLVLLAPAAVGASPAPQACSSPDALLADILSPAAQPPADAPEGLSPLEGTLDMTCSGYSCDDECAPCGGRLVACTNGEPACACWNC